ncbi:MAG: DUF1343 domain-containing protein, partial [Anaerolineae bacterium]|nr:DUF1343 domain-containing protein [Anaerolineae bacterium]
AAADGAAVDHARDVHTGLPVYSLYGTTREPTAAMLTGLDALVCDVQDVGARFYTFISTLYYVLRAAGRHGVPVIVLDRPNPIGGTASEGPLVAPGLESFIGIAPIPIRHGMTIGELARYFNAEFGFAADLTVVPLHGWRREMWFDETGRPWVPASPAMPHLSTATVYPGTCLIEGTNLAEGRGTALPFEQIGAPWLDGRALAAALNRLELPGVRFRPAAFVPTAGKHAGELCHGIQIHVTDRRAFRPVSVGLHIIVACRRQAPDRFAFLPSSWEGRPPHFDLLIGDPRIRPAILADVPAAELTATWHAVAADWMARRRPHLLYAG